MNIFATHKRLLVFCDGTAQDGLVCTDDGTSPDNSTPLYFTNVLRLSRAVKQYAVGHFGKHILQIVFYQSGVGTESDFKGHASTSDLALELFGTAVARKIRDAYAFLAQNYTEGDEIFIFGFSRGAYTARKIAGLIDRIGLLDVKDMGKFYTYCYALETKKGQLPPRPAKSVPIQVVGVWDTVGSIRTNLLEKWPGEVDQLSISDATLPRSVRVALHAISFHENRNWFQVTPWTLPDEKDQSDEEKAERQGQILKQVWFPGEHSDVGGGWNNHELADISLFWMASEVSQYIAINEEQLLEAIVPSPNKPAWGASIPHNSYMTTEEAVALVGRIEPLTRLEGGHITHESVFHPSILESPMPTPAQKAQAEKDAADKKDPAEKAKDANEKALLKAFSKHMITLDDLKKKFGGTWDPTVIGLNPLEQAAKDRWSNATQPTGDQASYESRAQLRRGDGSEGQTH